MTRCCLDEPQSMIPVAAEELQSHNAMTHDRKYAWLALSSGKITLRRYYNSEQIHEAYYGAESWS